jgi:hypothetical protein
VAWHGGEMSINKQVGPLITVDFRTQNICRLSEWFSKFNNAAEMLEEDLGFACLKYAIQENMWLTTTFLLKEPYLPRKALQLLHGAESPNAMCLMLIKSHVHKIECDQVALLQFLHERIRM